MKNLIKAIAFCLLIILTFLLLGCSSEPPRWKNATVHVFPEFPEKIYVKYGSGDFHEEENGENFNIDLTVNETNDFQLLVESFWNKIHNIHFDGEQKKGSEEHDLTRLSENKVMLTGKFIPGYDFYEIFISEDKQK